jgi:protein involved in polysaccharide export with SLBB domain
MKKVIIFNFLILASFLSIVFAQQKEILKQQAESQLQQMTPEQIDKKIKELGLTRVQAEARAKELGIDLQSFLQGQSKPGSVPVEVTPQAASETGKSSEVKAPEVTTQPIPSEQAVLSKVPIVAPPATGELPYFGYNIFLGGSSIFEPRPLIDDQYLIGENDILSISLWGDFQSYNEYKVDKEGRILVNTVGPVSVAGYTVEKARKIVLNALSKVYSGLQKSPPSMFMDLTVARIRPLRVFIMGEVANPGGYAVSAVGNVFNSLFSAGGPNLSGSLREVKVIRNNKVISKVDLYDYLIGNLRASDEQIKDNDVIFVSLRGKTVGIKGAVMRQAYFELLPNDNLKKLIDFSGGIRNTFYLQRIQVDRIIPFEERKKGEPDRKVFDIDFKEILTAGKDYKLEDGDIITIFPILEEKKNYAQISGSVWRPGRYQLEKIASLKDLVKEADGLRPEAFPEHTKIVRTYDDKQTVIFYVNIELAEKGEKDHNIKLQPRDSIYVFSRYEMLTGHETITLEGIAKRPGKYPLHQNQTLYDFVHEAVGLADTLYRKQIYLDRADLVRLNPDQYTSRIVPFNLWDLYIDHVNDTLLLPGDRVIIYPVSTVEFTDRYVDVSGKVKSPGRYRLSENMKAFDLIMQAGGYTEDAWTVQGELSRLERNGIGNDSLTHIYKIDIPDLFDSTTVNQQIISEYRAKSTLLQHRDQLFIRPNPNYLYQKSVTINGEVEYAGTYVLSKYNERLSNVVKRSGGLKKSGYAEGGIVLRNGTRTRINVAEAIDNPEGNNDLMLQQGDSIIIPPRPFSVQVIGEVNNPGLFSCVDGKKLSFYVDESGGLTDSSDFALVTYPTGMIEKVGFHWWSSNPKISDGTNILVTKKIPPPPEPPEEKGQRVTLYDVVKDMSAILVSTLTILVLAKQIK